MTLLEYLTEWNKVEDFKQLLEDLADGYSTMDDYKQNPEVYNTEEIEFLETDLEDLEEEFYTYKSKYCRENPNADWEEELKQFKKK